MEQAKFFLKKCLSLNPDFAEKDISKENKMYYYIPSTNYPLDFNDDKYYDNEAVFNNLLLTVMCEKFIPDGFIDAFKKFLKNGSTSRSKIYIIFVLYQNLPDEFKTKFQDLTEEYKGFFDELKYSFFMKQSYENQKKRFYEECEKLQKDKKDLEALENEIEEEQKKLFDVSRKKEILELNEKIKELNADIARREEENAQKLKELETIKADLENQVATQEKVIKQLEDEVAKLGADLVKLQNILDKAEKKNQDFEAQIKKMTIQEQDSALKLAAAEQKFNDLEDDINTLSDSGNADDIKNEKLKEILKILVMLDDYAEEKEKESEQTIKQLDTTKTELEKLKEKYDKESEKLKEDIGSLKFEISEMKVENDKLLLKKLDEETDNLETIDKQSDIIKEKIKECELLKQIEQELRNNLNDSRFDNLTLQNTIKRLTSEKTKDLQKFQNLIEEQKKKIQNLEIIEEEQKKKIQKLENIGENANNLVVAKKQNQTLFQRMSKKFLKIAEPIVLVPAQKFTGSTLGKKFKAQFKGDKNLNILDSRDFAVMDELFEDDDTDYEVISNKDLNWSNENSNDKKEFSSIKTYTDEINSNDNYIDLNINDDNEELIEEVPSVKNLTPENQNFKELDSLITSKKTALNENEMNDEVNDNDFGDLYDETPSLKIESLNLNDNEENKTDDEDEDLNLIEITNSVNKPNKEKNSDIIEEKKGFFSGIKNWFSPKKKSEKINIEEIDLLDLN